MTEILPWDEALCISNLRYSPPREINISGIDGVVVDPHNEVFPFWWNIFTGQPAVVIHVDHHDDMAAWAKTWENESKDGELFLESYSRHLGIDNFISAAMFYGKVGPVFHIDPRKDHVDAYGRVGGGHLSHPELEDSFGTIIWKGIHEKGKLPDPTKLSYEEFIKELRGYKGPIILDTDLDAFECVTDPGYKDQWQISREELLDIVLNPPDVPRLQKVVNLLSHIPRPQHISIAKSLTGSRIWTPHYRADALEFETIKEYSQLYK